MNVRDFQELIWEKGRELYRDMPWRQNTTPYYVLVSEIMLQQTQVDRVIPKFSEFITRFPTIEALAGASLSDVLIVWSGLGYNRRAKYLHEAAQKIVADFCGTIPEELNQLITLPGVGPNTAGAILAYSFNQPVPFIETNIRTVYFHHFFADQQSVSDKELRDIIAKTVDHEHPREWYWVLMDYGAFLKKQGAGRLNQAAGYRKQAPLKGSVREVRGMILKALRAGEVSRRDLAAAMPADDRFVQALDVLLSEGLIDQTSNRLHLRR